MTNNQKTAAFSVSSAAVSSALTALITLFLTHEPAPKPTQEVKWVFGRESTALSVDGKLLLRQLEDHAPYWYQEDGKKIWRSCAFLCPDYLETDCWHNLEKHRRRETKLRDLENQQ